MGVFAPPSLTDHTVNCVFNSEVTNNASQHISFSVQEMLQNCQLCKPADKFNALM